MLYFYFSAETRECACRPKRAKISSPRVSAADHGRVVLMFHRDSGCVVGLFRAGVLSKVTHKGNRASVDYRSSHNKEVLTMRGTSFRRTARRRFSIACAPNARVFSNEIAEMEIVSCGARSDVTQQCSVSKSAVAFVGHDMLFTRNYGNCERMHRTLAYPTGLSFC